MPLTNLPDLYATGAARLLALLDAHGGTYSRNELEARGIPACAPLLQITIDGEARFPKWQFSDEATSRELIRITSLLGPIPALAKIRFFLSPQPALDGRTPLDALHAGDVGIVENLVELYVQQGPM